LAGSKSQRPLPPLRQQPARTCKELNLKLG
jgi:hypothetical protein